MLDEPVTTVWEIAVKRAVTGDVFNGACLYCPFFYGMSWMKSGTKLGQFLRVSYLRLLRFSLCGWQKAAE